MKRCDCCGFNPLYTGHKRVEEKRIGELEKIVADLFPESKGNIQKVDLGKLLEQAGFDLLYKKLPVIFPDITRDDIKNAYMSELEQLIEVFVEVNFQGLKRVIKPLMGLIQAGLQQKS
jgi:Ca2+-binding EF-hand superfamily protein